jgi:quercetin dioxygenase-like cupin family protein
MSLLDFSKLDMKKNPDHTGVKEISIGNKRVQIVQYEENASHPDWCTAGHIGFVLEGEIMYELERGELRVQKGKGFILPTGTRHRGHNVFPGVTRFFLVDE